MKPKKTFFAVDLGATSGRTILASFDQENGQLSMDVLNRFPNHLLEVGTSGTRHFHWDIYELFRNIVEGLKIAASRKVEISSIGIDTWGCDFVMVGKDGAFLRLPYAYRDPHTDGAADKFFKRVPRSQVYGLTGIQIMNFNSLFQMDTLRRNSDSAFALADKLLFMPDALSYMLTGNMVTEYSIASTAQIVNAKERKLETSLLKEVGLTEDNFGKFVFPGTQVGVLTEELQRITGLGAVPVIAVAGHDTASAVASVPAKTANFAYLSSGTWSLMGIEAAQPVISSLSEKLNFTNEGGVEGTIRVLKNICGMWLLERCRQSWGEIPYSQLMQEAIDAEGFDSIIDPDDPSFANPVDMQAAIVAYCESKGMKAPSSRGEFCRCIYKSLAAKYALVLESLNKLSDKPIEVLHIIGGGSMNELLNQWTADAVGIPVACGPQEATALGNVMIQAIACGVVKDVADARRILSESLDLKMYYPKN